MTPASCRLLLALLMLTRLTAGAPAQTPGTDALGEHGELILSATQGWGELGINEAAHAPGVKALPLAIAGHHYARGLGTHANSDILVFPNGAYAAFDAEVGAQDGNGHSVVFQILVDDRKVFDSGLMRLGESAKPVHIPLAGATALRLIVNDGGDGIASDGAVWGDARLTRAPQAPAKAGRTAEGVDIAPFARVITDDPARMDGARNECTASFPESELFLDRELRPDAAGLYAAARWKEAGCIGLEWIESRRLSGVALQFAGAAQAPSPEGAQLQYWTLKLPMAGTPGVSRWQGRWQPLKGAIRAEGDRWLAAIDWRDNPEMRLGTLKIRWILPARTADAALRKLSAWTVSSWQTANLQLQLEHPQPGQTGQVEVYSGEIVEGARSVLSRSWNLAGPLALKVRASKPMPWMTDRTILRVKLPGAAFGVGVDDILSSGCVYVRDAGFFAASQPLKVTLAEYKKQTEGKKTILQQVRALPDQTFAQANARVHHPNTDEGPTALSLACDNHKFVLARDGSVEFNNDPAVADHGYSLWKQDACQVKPEWGSDASQPISRALEGGWLPIPVITTDLQCLRTRQRTFVAPFDKTPLAKDAPAWLNRKPLCLLEYTIENPTATPADVAFSLNFLTPEGKGSNAPLQTAGNRILAIKDGKLMAALLIKGDTRDLKMDAKEGRWSLTGKLAAGGRVQCLLQIPAWAAKAEELPDWNQFEGLLAATKAYWFRLVAPAMRIEVPEPMLQNVILASQVHCLMAARNEDGERVAPWIAAMDYGPLESEANSVIRGMQFIGHEDFARRGFDFFIKRYNPEGFLTTGYTVMGTGWHLWTLGEYSALYRNDAWLKKIAPEVTRVCNWVMAQREKTKKLDADGAKIPEYGLMPPGVMADWGVYQYYFYLNGYYYAGLKAAAEALSAIGDPRAGEMLASAAEHRADILRAFHQTQAQAPVVALRDGSWVPEYPTCVYCPSPIGNFYAGEDVGRSWCYDVELGAHHLIPLGVMDCRSPDARWTINHMEDVQFLGDGRTYYPAAKSRADWFNLGGFAKIQPYYARNVEVYALQDELKPFIRSYFNTLISLLNREDLSIWEDLTHCAFNKTHETGYFLYQTRTMLLTERGQELWLAPFVTDQWMKEGMTVAVGNAPTRFGPAGYRITSHVKDGYIQAAIDPPTRQAPDALVLRLRHPDGKPMRKVLVNGKAVRSFDNAKQIIRLKPVKSKITVRAEY